MVLMMRLSRMDTYNVTFDCARHMKLAGKTCYDAMVHIVDDCLTTPESELVIKPFGERDRIDTD